MHTYIFHWSNGAVSTLDGNNAADALNRAGYSQAVVTSLSFIEQVQ